MGTSLSKQHIVSPILLLFCWILWKNRAKPNKTIPLMPNYLPYIGHLYRTITAHKRRKYFDLYESLKKKNFPNVCHGSSAFLGNSIILNDPKLIKHCFETKFESFDKGKRVRDALNDVLGNGIFTADPDTNWKFHRKIASRMFSMRNLKTYMFSCAQKGTERWLTKVEELRTDKHNPDGVIDVYEMLARFTLDVFFEIAFGKSLNIIEEAPKVHPFAEAFDKAIEIISFRFRDPTAKLKKYFQIGYEKEMTKHVKVINQFASKIIDSIRETDTNYKHALTDETGDSKYNILSLFLKFKPDLTNQELRDIGMNFLIAGRDTTRLLLSWFLFELSQNKNVEEKIMQEIEIFDKFENDISYSNIQNHYDDPSSNQSEGTTTGNKEKRSYFKYLEAALLETLRLHSVVPFLVRSAKEDVKLPGTEHVIKKGNMIIVQTWVYGRLEKIWGKDAWDFKPERFMQKGVHQYSPEVYPFFNLNPRLCLGRHVALMEAKLMAICFLKKYQFQVCKNQKIQVVSAPVLNMKYGMKINISPRLYN